MDRAKYMADYMTKRYHERRAYWIDYLGGECVVCGTKENLEFDHIVSSEKEYEIARILSTHSEVKVQYEMAKCQLLCYEHHLEKSIRDGDIRTVDHGQGLTGKKNCYCDLCKPLKIKYNIDKGYRKPAKKKKEYICGERRTYLNGCRCRECKSANTEYSKNLQKKKALEALK